MNVSKPKEVTVDDTMGLSETDQDMADSDARAPTPWQLRKPSNRTACLLISISLIAMAAIATFIGVTRSSVHRKGMDLNDCYANHAHLEYMTAGDWWLNTRVPRAMNTAEQRARFQWIQSRQPFQPIHGDATIIAGVIYTLHKGILRMTILFPPLFPQEGRNVTVSLKDNTSNVEKTGFCEISENTWHCPVQMDNVDSARDYFYEVSYQIDPNDSVNTSIVYPGIIPRQVDFPRIAALSCFGEDDTKDKDELVDAILEAKPDLLVLQGDQTYMDVLGYGFLELIYTMSNITRSIPTLVQLDDHDYGQGNLIGADWEGETSGAGFSRPPCIVNSLQNLAIGHMPAPALVQLLDNGIESHYTSYRYGSVDFALLEARKFKSFDSSVGSLLGIEQEGWLENWCNSSNAPLKVMLSQTPFASLATNITLPGPVWKGRLGPIRMSDTRDSNAFPPAGRQRFMEIASQCSPLIISGDQHLGIAVTYENYGISECASPAAINDIFWRLNFEIENQTTYDHYEQPYKLHRAWNVGESVWRNYRPNETRYETKSIKAARGDGFLVINLDGVSATCSLHEYRLSHKVAWAVTLPAKASEAL